MKNHESPFSPSLCNYYEETPTQNKNNDKFLSIKQVNLNIIYNENDSISKGIINEGNSLKINKTPIKYIKSQLNNNNFQLNNNINNSSLSYQYSDSEKNSEKSKILIVNNKEKKKNDNLIIQKNENLEIITSNNEYQVSQCISVNNIYSSFSIEINPKNKIEKYLNKELKIDNIPQINFISKKTNDKQLNNGFKLFPLNIIEDKNIETSLNYKYKTIKNYSPNNNNSLLKNPFSDFNREKTNKFLFKNLLSKFEKNENSKERQKSLKSENNENIINTNNENKIKPNSNNDINEIIKRHFQQNSIPFYSKSKKQKENNISNNKKIISFTSFSNKVTKKPLTSEITKNLIKEFKKKNKTQIQYYTDNKNNNYNKNKQENKNTKIKNKINLSSILNKFSKNKSKENKSLNNIKENFIDNKSADKKIIKTNEIKKQLLKESINNNIKYIKKENNITTNNSNNNSYKNIYTQDTETNNLITTTTNYTLKKSPKVMKDFSFYKKKVTYRTHFVSLINTKENNQNDYNCYNNHFIENCNYKFFPKKKQPIASIKLMKLEGDIDSNISRESFN